MTKNFGSYQFNFVAEIHLDTDRAGNIIEYSYELPRSIRPNRYAAGPFCRFDMHGATAGPGVYAITVGGELKYVGECEDLSHRFGPNGYGYIAARNCHSDGQATNCKVNALILVCARVGDVIRVWFHQARRHKAIEGELIDELRPPWNGRQRSGDRNSGRISKMENMMRPAGVFRAALEQEFTSAVGLGLRSITIRAGDLHRAVGGYPGKNHRMPLCCEVMRSAMQSGDKVLENPSSGAGASLRIEYRLRRRAIGGA